MRVKGRRASAAGPDVADRPHDIGSPRRQEQCLETFRPAVGETVHIGHGVTHKFTCVGDSTARAIAVALPSFEEYFRELAVAWPHDHWESVATPAAMAPIAQRFEVNFVR